MVNGKCQNVNFLSDEDMSLYLCQMVDCGEGKCADGYCYCEGIDERFDHDTLKCACAFGYERNDNGDCEIRLNCPKGHVWDNKGQTCIDNDECKFNEDDCTKDQTCHNTPGSWVCCDKNTEFDEVSQ